MALEDIELFPRQNVLDLYSKTCLKRPLERRQKFLLKTDYHLMQVKSIAECLEHSAMISTFIYLPIVFNTFVLSIFEWPLKTSLTVYENTSRSK